jgi:ATP-dependent Lon protease
MFTLMMTSDCIPHQVPPEELGRLLGPRKYEREAREPFTRPGIALGLAWTPAGGELLFIESSRMRGSGQVHISLDLPRISRDLTRISSVIAS